MLRNETVGNRTSSLGTASYSYNSSNELTSTSAATYAYDNNGNVLTQVAGSSTTSFAWDFENRLSSVTLPAPGGTVTFKYDPFGRRIEKISPTSVTSIYIYDGDNQIEEVNASGTAVARYTQGLGIDEPLVLLRAGVTSYYHADGMGSVNALRQLNGSYDEVYKYDSFGVRTGFDGNITNAFQYTARERDDETSLYFYRARYDDPSVGRFLSEDPLRWNAANNFYQYVNNSPNNASDPLGLSPCTDNCRRFRRYCYFTASVTGFLGGWGCRTVCISVLKTPLTCWTFCSAGAGVAVGALQLGCLAGYKACVNKCNANPSSCPPSQGSQPGGGFGGQVPQTNGPLGPAGGGGGGGIPQPGGGFGGQVPQISGPPGPAGGGGGGGIPQ